MRRLKSLSGTLLLVLASCAHAPRAADNGVWLQLESEHFILRTDLGEADARAAIVELERVRVAIVSAWWQGPRSPEGKLAAIELADDAELSAFVQHRIAGYVASDVFGERVLVMSAEQSPSQQPLLKHELSHSLGESFLQRQPRWLLEGLACYLETLRLDFANDRFVLGEPDRDRVRFLATHPVMDYGPVLAMGSELLTLAPAQGCAFETASWLLLHYLADEKRPQLDDFLGRLAVAEDPARAFAEAFPGLTADQLGRDVNAYWQVGRLGSGSVPLPRYQGAISVSALPVAEVHALRAGLYLQSVGRLEGQRARAAVEMSAALAIDPQCPTALWVEASLTGMRNPQVALAATEKHPGDWRSFWLLAEATAPGDPAARRAALEKAAELAPANASVLNALAWQSLAQPALGQQAQPPQSQAEPAKALLLAQRAVELAPGNPSYLDTLALALASAGRCAEATNAEERAIEVLPDRAAPQAFADLRARLVKLQATCAVPRPKLAVETEPRRKSCKGSGPLITAKQKRAGAKITVEVLVAADGAPGDVTVRSGNAQLLGPVREWLRSCAFEPATRDGQPIESRMISDFSLEQRAVQPQGAYQGSRPAMNE